MRKIVPRLLRADIKVTGTDQNKNRRIKNAMTIESRKSLPCAEIFNHCQLISPGSKHSIYYEK